MLTVWSVALAENMKNCPASRKYQPGARQRNGKRCSAMFYIFMTGKRQTEHEIPLPYQTSNLSHYQQNSQYISSLSLSAECKPNVGLLHCSQHPDSVLLPGIPLRATISSLIYSTAGNVKLQLPGAGCLPVGCR